MYCLFVFILFFVLWLHGSHLVQGVLATHTHTLTHIPIKYVNCDICRFVVAISAAAIVAVVVVAVVVVAAALTFNPNMSALSRSMHN